jgi:putative transposase
MSSSRRNGGLLETVPPPLTNNKSVFLAVADDPVPSLVLTYKYRLLPTRNQHKALAAILESQRQLYNGALEHRIGAYRKTGKTITLYSQQKELAELRKELEFARVPSNLQRWTLRRLDEAYQGFFDRLKSKNEKAGFPRFRGKGRWNSFGFAEFSGIRLIGKRLRFKGMPSGLRIHLHRPLPEGRPLCCTFTRDHKGWSVSLQYRVPVKALPLTGSQVGIDMGLKELVVQSRGETVPNPRIAKRAEREMRRRQRALSRCINPAKKMLMVRADLAVSREASMVG